MSNANPNIHLKGYTALHVAAEQGSAETVKTLLKFGAETEARTEPRKETAIHLVSCKGDFESFSNKVHLLVEKHADINAQNVEQDTALHLAICRIGTVDAVNVLLKFKSSTELKGRDGHTALQLAISLDREDIATVLLAHSADTNCVDNNGLTPLHLATRSNKISTEFLVRLIDATADVNKEDGNHHTPLYEAITLGKTDKIRLLLSRGAECRPHHEKLQKYLGRPALWQRISVRAPRLSE